MYVYAFCICEGCIEHMCTGASGSPRWYQESSSVSPTLLNEAGFLNQTQSSLMSSLANQLALGIPSLPFDAGMTGRLPHLLSIYIDFWGFEL